MDGIGWNWVAGWGELVCEGEQRRGEGTGASLGVTRQGSVEKG